MANFTPIKDQIIPIEGGYVWNKNDPGGETKYGISKRSYPHLDIKNLTLDEANDIYKRDFWNVMKLDKVIDQTIAEKVFWFGVHSGPTTSIKCLQRSISKILNSSLQIDGILGNQTLSMLNNMIIDDPGRAPYMYSGTPIQTIKHLWLLDSLKLEQIAYYANIVNTKPSTREFLLGWINRSLKG